ncbi:Rieske 2Fe-2S domain-containing protein [Dehalococcoidia bacterium]|nr:Rieske 2Fe-2S domain-containing protein [Dehalococcoidia bacterium]
MVELKHRPVNTGTSEAVSATATEAFGASQIGPFDYCPKLGFREYWYPALWKKKVGRRPVNVTMLGEELVFFRGKEGRVEALSDWCPHRGARLSRGFSEFPGTVTCPYHGYTFDDTGQCVAGLIEADVSPLAAKMKARKYPTAEWQGIIFVWMGITEPVPLEEDLPWEFREEGLTGRRFSRVRDWHANWTEPVNQGVDNHGLYLHRGLTFWRLTNRKLLFFRKKPIQTGPLKIVEEGDNYVNVRFGAIRYGQAEYPGLGKWPRRVWWRFLPVLKGPGGRESNVKGGLDDTYWAGHDHNVELPSKVRIPSGLNQYLRWGVPIDEENTRMWTFLIWKRPKNIVHYIYQYLYYHLWRKQYEVIGINEKQDLEVFLGERLNYDSSQKLGMVDVAVIYFRRHLAKRARDFKRLGGAFGCFKQPPDQEKVAEWTQKTGKR